MSTQIQLRRDTAADWTSNNPTLAAGEIGWESDTGAAKIGDGSTAWTSLDYWVGKWQDWTPTLTNLTQGNGTVEARYIQVGKLVTCRFLFTLGSTSAVAATASFSLPVTAASANAVNRAFSGWMLDAGSHYRPLGLWQNGTTTQSPSIYYYDYSSSRIVGTNLGPTTPITWATGDQLAVSGSYEAA